MGRLTKDSIVVSGEKPVIHRRLLGGRASEAPPSESLKNGASNSPFGPSVSLERGCTAVQPFTPAVHQFVTYRSEGRRVASTHLVAETSAVPLGTDNGIRVETFRTALWE